MIGCNFGQVAHVTVYLVIPKNQGVLGGGDHFINSIAVPTVQHLAWRTAITDLAEDEWIW